MRNVEIKAKIKNLAGLLKNAKALSGFEGEIIPQTDVFFKVQTGRLKLRKFKDGHGELIYYDRPDNEGPKLSSYEKTDVEAQNVGNLQKVLERALGAIGTVQKTRQLFLVDQTRVHIDVVEGLGEFMELEVVLKPEQSAEDGQVIAEGLMRALEVQKEDLVMGAYHDLLPKMS